MTFNLQGAEFKCDAIVADISRPILGWSFLAAHQLDLVWKGKKCVLKGPQCTIKLELHSGDDLKVAQITYDTYQKWSSLVFLIQMKGFRLI